MSRLPNALPLEERQELTPLLHTQSTCSDGSDFMSSEYRVGADYFGEGYALPNDKQSALPANFRANVHHGRIDYRATQTTRASYPTYRSSERDWKSYWYCSSMYRCTQDNTTADTDTTVAPYHTPFTGEQDRYYVDGREGGYEGLTRTRSAPALSTVHVHRISVFEGVYDNFIIAPGGSLWSSGFNLASATLGAGVLALPSAFEGIGVLLGVIILLAVYMTNMYSVSLLIKAGEATKLFSFEELAYELGGPLCQGLTVFCMVVFCWGVGVSYIVSMGDFIEQIIAPLGLSDYLDRRSAMLIFWSLIMLPLSLVRNVNTLRYASGLGVMSSLLLSLALVMKFAENPDMSHTQLVCVNDRFINSISTFIFSYCFQPVLFQVYVKMQRRTLKRISLCSMCTMGLCTVVYVTTGFFGALAYGELTQPNILTNLSSQLYLFHVILAYIGVIVSVTMAFPMTILPTRDSILIAMGYGENGNTKEQEDTLMGKGGVSKHCDKTGAPTYLSMLVGALLSVLALFIGFFIPNIQDIFSLLGSICGGSLSFMLPGWFVMRLSTRLPDLFSKVDLFGARVLFSLGLFVCVLGTYNSVVNTLATKKPNNVIAINNTLF